MEYGWDIINEDGFDIAQLSEVYPELTAQSFFTETVELDAFAEGIVQVGLLAVDATGRVAVTVKSMALRLPRLSSKMVSWASASW